MWEDVLSRTDMMFCWKQPGKRSCDVLLECMLERTCDVQRGYKYNPTDSGRGLCCIGTRYHSLLVMVFADNALWYWFALLFFAGHHLS